MVEKGLYGALIPRFVSDHGTSMESAECRGIAHGPTTFTGDLLTRGSYEFFLSQGDFSKPPNSSSCSDWVLSYIGLR